MIWFDDKLLSWFLSLPSLLLAQRIPLFLPVSEFLFLTCFLFYSIKGKAPAQPKDSGSTSQAPILTCEDYIVLAAASWKKCLQDSTRYVHPQNHRVFSRLLPLPRNPSLFISTVPLFIFILSTPSVLHHLLIFKCWYSRVKPRLILRASLFFQSHACSCLLIFHLLLLFLLVTFLNLYPFFCIFVLSYLITLLPSLFCRYTYFLPSSIRLIGESLFPFLILGSFFLRLFLLSFILSFTPFLSAYLWSL